MAGSNQRDPLDSWLEEQVQPLSPPPGTFEMITRRARRRKVRKLAVTVVSAAAVAAAVVVAVPVLTSMHLTTSSVPVNPAAGQSAASHTVSQSPSGTASQQMSPSQSHSQTPSPTGPASAVSPPPGPMPANFQPSSVTFISTDNAWVIGQAGTPGKCANTNPSICTSVAWTSDTGKTWHGAPAPNTGAPSGPTGVGGIRFLDGINGWAFGPELWATHDAGNTWHQVPTGGRRVTDLEAAGNRAYALFASCSGSHAYSFAGGCTSYTLMTATADSDTWAPVGQATTGLTNLGAATSASITLTGSDGYLVAPDGTLYSGPIGGAWQRAGNLPCLVGLPQPSGLPGGALFAATADSHHLTAVCVGPAPAEPSRVFTSGDGASWAQQPAAAWGNLAVPVAVDTTALTAAPDGTLVLATTHGLYVFPAGGSQWKAATAANAPSSGFSYVGMTTNSQGVALPADTTRHEIWMTFDGGLTWAPRTVAG
jgi:hypothetical protein